MQSEVKILGKLPVHPVGRREDGIPVLRVDGLVGRTLELTESDFDGLPQHEMSEDFTCEEGWTVPAVQWWGIDLKFVLALAEIDPKAQWIQASAGEFSVPIPLQDARRALLATRLGDAALPAEHGGPVRLVVPGGDCWTSIKWLDHLELRSEPGENTGKTIALGRCQVK
jgi:DMSO/TMAO reductase YedYZ molybdopterin-dependent catalytic subunit